ncbi:MAG: long-chain fatty acid--CoA ligase [Hyphomicrobiales bacterium]|nr:long-chain fatty acid--CoA ligase [Hyphomicrobiales bacterium]
MDISTWIDRHAVFTPDKTAIRFDGKDISYTDLAKQIDVLAVILRDDFSVGRGTRVGFLGHNHPVFFVLLFACARLGAIAMPLNWRLEAVEHKEILLDCSPAVLLVEFRFEAHARLICHDLPTKILIIDELSMETRDQRVKENITTYDDPVLLCYTSGATGRPKGVVLDQNALFYNSVNSSHMHGMTGDDVVLCTLPLFHVGGINIQSLPVLHQGGTLVLHAVFDVALTYHSIEQDRITHLVLVPTQIIAMIADYRWSGADFGTLRAIATGSTVVSTNLIEKVHLRGIPLIQVYGSTETAPLVTYLTVDNAMENVGSVGKAAIHCEIRIVDNKGDDVESCGTGEILVRGPNVMCHYWNAPKRTAEALAGGWFHTGDVGYLDDNGFLFVSDRKKDMIISGGENVYSAELENIMAECRSIVETAVVGRSDATWGEIVVAVVVVQQGQSMSETEVIKLFDGRLARYKHPRQVVFSDALPRNAMGKVEKDILRKQVADIADVTIKRSVG